MTSKIRPLVRPVIRAAAVAAFVAMLSGCQGIIGSPSDSQVRIIDVSSDAPGMDIYQSHNALAYSLGFGTITSYVPVMAGTYPIAAQSSETGQVISAAKGTFLPATQYTVLIGDIASSPQQLILKDQNQPAPPGHIAIRLVDRAVRAGVVDVYLIPPGQRLADTHPVVSNVTFSANTGYLEIPKGTYTLVILPAGTIPTETTVPAYTGTQVAYGDGSARTLVLIDQRFVGGYGLQVISADDYAGNAN